MQSWHRGGLSKLRRGVAEAFCSRWTCVRFRNGRAGLSYLTPNDEYSLLQLLLYILSFFAMILIFLYIASERPGEKKKKDEDEED
jgi:hypothetical protein